MERTRRLDSETLVKSNNKGDAVDDETEESAVSEFGTEQLVSVEHLNE